MAADVHMGNLTRVVNRLKKSKGECDADNQSELGLV
jgi:hypothetical protein